jgi:MFS family permease
MHLPHLDIYKLVAIRSEIKEIYLASLLHTLAISMVSIYIPIYLLQLGYSLSEALLFLIFFHSGMLVFSLSVVWIESKIGTKHTVALSSLFYLVFFLLLVSIEEFLWLIFFIAIINSFAHSLYWIPINSNFAKYSHKWRRGTEVGYLIGLIKIISLLAPLIGAALIAFFGFSILFFVVCIAFLLTALPLFATREYRPRLRRSWRKIFSGANLSFFGAFISKGTLFGVANLWPIFVFLIFGKYLLVGLAASATGVGAAIFTVFVGKLSDRIDRNKLIKIGGLANFIVWFLAVFAGGSWYVFAISFSFGFVFALVHIPFFAIACDAASRQNIAEFMAFRTIGINIGRVVIFIVALFAIGFQFQAAFLIAALSSLYFFVTKPTGKRI